jgi:hypothetical protein
MTPRRKRFAIALGILAVVGAVTALVLNAFQSNLVFFYTPSQIAASEAPSGRTFRVGGLVLAGSVFVILAFSILILGLISGTVAGLAAALSPLSLVLPATILARRLGWSWSPAVYVPFMLPLFLYALLNSAFTTLRRGGIRWRDTFYPLKVLRAGNVR